MNKLKPVKKCQKCQATQTKLEPRQDLIGNPIPNAYICVKYWNGCRNRVLEKNE